MPGVIPRQTLPRGGNRENLNLDNRRQMDSGIKFFGTILLHVLVVDSENPFPLGQSEMIKEY